MKGTEKIIIAHSDIDFCNRFAQALEKCGFEVSVVKSLKDIIKKVEATGSNYQLMGIPIDEIDLAEVGFLERFMESSNWKNTRLFAIISQSTKFSQVVLEKIKALKPRDFIVVTSSSDEMVFRLSNILFEDRGVRKNYRALLKIIVHCDYMQDFFDAESFTISRDGIFLKTDRRFPMDAKIFLIFKLPQNGRDFATLGNVLYSVNEKSPKPRVSPTGSGLFFVDLNDDERNNIDRYIRGSA